MKPLPTNGSLLLVRSFAALSLLTCTQADLTHRWSFNAASGDALRGTVMTDSVSNAVATVQGNGSTFNGTALTITGTTTGNRSRTFISGYVDLPNGIISNRTNLSVELWATPLSATNYGRIFDFGRVNTAGLGGGEDGEIIDQGQGELPGFTNSSDGMMLSFSLGTDLAQQRLEGRLNGANVAIFDSALPTTAGIRHHYVTTFADGEGVHGSSGGRITWYRDGTLIGFVDVAFHLSDLEDVNNWLGRSQFTGDDNANASFDELRLYDHVMDEEEIAANLAAGPDGAAAPPPEPDHLWVFNDAANSAAPSGQTFTDSIGGMVATLRGQGGALTGTSVRLPGSTTGNQPLSSISAYLDLPNGIVSAPQAITFEAWATPLSSKNWQRLFDFGRCTSVHGSGAATGEILDTAFAPGATAAYDNLSLTLNNGGNLNSHQLEGQYDGNPPQYTFSTAATTAGTQYHYVFVIQNGAGEFGANGCQARWYRDGVLQNSDDFPFLASEMEDVNNWIGRSMYSGDSNSHLSLNELRIYNRAISAAEIQASYMVGPDPGSGPPEPLPPVPVPENRWDFNAAAGSAQDGATFTDVGSGEVATVRGNGATTTGTALTLPGNTTGNQAAETISGYLDLPNGFVSSRPSATYEIWLTPVSSKNWQRVFDFGRCDLTANSPTPGEIIDGAFSPGNTTSYDGIMLSLNSGGALGSHRLETIIGDGSVSTVNTDLSGTTAAGTEYHYALVVEDGAGSSGSAGCQCRWYRNGELQGSMDLAYRISSIADVNNWIGRSAWSGDSNSHVTINELRVHPRAVTTLELLASAAAGPDATFDPPVAVADSATIHPDQKVLVDVLANDTGSPIAATLEIVAPPAIGTATISNGKILYAHGGSSAGPITFTYGVGNVSGATSTATVTIGFASSLRLANPGLAMPEAPPTSTWQLVDALPGLTFNQPLCIASIPGDSHRLFVCERMAKIKHVPDVTASSLTQNTFLDLQAVIAGRTPAETIEGGGNGEHGLLGLAFHPQYESNGYFYVAYTVRIDGGAYHQRISRFQASADPTVADPASELILLQQLDRGSNHDGGDIHFGPNDGYLYYTAGDEENPNDFRLQSQRIDKDFFCGVFRIDVDKKPGNLEPNPHAAIPTDGGIARFSVPVDNPFVHTSLGGDWDGSYNGVAVTPLSAVRTEFWATGLRHTWRMSFDPATGDLWGGDVGQNTYEEVNKIVKGGNYGWVYREGAHDTAFTNPVPPTKPEGFTSIDPAYEYVHAAIAGGDASLKGNSVVGGYVYRGTRYPSLAGTYVFSDSVSGHVWQMDTTTGTTTRLTGLPGAYGVFSAQGVDPFNKDLYFAAYLTGKIMRLTTSSDLDEGFPGTLGATGLFADLTDLSPAPGLLPYQPNLTFWSDHAIKQRWFTIPDATDKMTWSKDGTWTYPTGMLWVKHFDLELSRGDPGTRKRIETRVLVKTDTGSYGVSYRWNEAQTEATLVEDAGTEFDISIDDHGTPHIQRWQIPGRSSCITCHTPHGGHALSFNTRQLNREENINGYSGNQLDLLSAYGYLNNDPDPAASLPRHVRPDETQYPLEQRARSYFAVNCSYCHQAGGSVAGFWDGRPQLTLEQTGLVHGEAENNGGDPANKYIVPGDPSHSLVLNRIAAANGFSRMPPLGSSELDQTNIQLITDWINGELAENPLYDQWRDGFFASLDPEGEKGADPDGDGVTNYDEYLLGSSPVSGANPWQASLADGKLAFPRQSRRYYAIETSDDLGTWEPWSIPEIDSVYQTTDTITEIPLPADPGGKKFFRFQVTEP